MIDEQKILELFDYWCKKLRVHSNWDLKLEFVTDPEWRKTGDLKIDCDDICLQSIFYVIRANGRRVN